MNKLLLFISFLIAVTAVPIITRQSASVEDTLFEQFKTKYGKVYFDEHDEQYRKSVFVANLKKIQAHNVQFSAGVHTYTKAVNSFADMTGEEFHARYTGFLGLRSRFARSQNVAKLNVKAPASVDWTTQGAVTPVKNQGQCGSCWSFSTTGSVEGAWFLAKKQLISLSEQQLMDCSKSEGNNSCEGGLMDYAFEFIIKNNGICTEQSYPYTAADSNTCQTTCSNVATISSYNDVAQTEDDLLNAVAITPVSVAIEADQEAFQFYSSGVMTGDCGTNLDHGVLAVGYGTDSGTAYWKVKNSWGGDWGMSGYILLQRNKNQDGGQCGIHLAASYPVV